MPDDNRFEIEPTQMLSYTTPSPIGEIEIVVSGAKLINRVTQKISNVDEYLQGFSLDNSTLPTDSILYDKNLNIVEKVGDVTDFSKIKYIEHEGKKWEVYYDSWGNPYFNPKEAVKVENPEVIQAFSDIEKLWEMADDENQIAAYCIQAFGEHNFEEWQTALKGVEQIQSLYKYDKGINLGNQESLDQLRGYLEYVGDTKLLNKCELLWWKPIGDYTQEEKLLVLGIKYKDIFIPPLEQKKLNQFNSKFVFAEFIQEQILRKAVNFDEVLRLHRESVSKMIESAREHGLDISHLATGYSTYSMRLLPNTREHGVGGHPSTIFIDRFSSTENLLALINHENVHIIINNAREIGQHAKDKNLPSCEEGYVDALRVLMGTNGNIDLALKTVFKLPSAYTPAVYQILTVCSEIEAQGQNAYMLLLKGLQRIANGVGDNPLAVLFEAYPKSKDRLQVYDDNYHRISITRYEKEEDLPEPKIPDIENLSILIDTLNFQGYARFVEENNIPKDSYFNEDDFSRWKNNIRLEVNEIKMYTLDGKTSPGTFDQYLFYLLSSADSQIRKEVNDLLRYGYELKRQNYI